MNRNEDIRSLYFALMKTERNPYFKLKAELIKDYGYDGFREIQKESFKLIKGCSCGVGVW